MSRKGENIYKRKDGRWEGRYKKGIAPNGRTLYCSCYGKTYREVKEILIKRKQTPPVSPENKKLFGAYCDEWLLFNQNKVKESTRAKILLLLKTTSNRFWAGFNPKKLRRR